jgi:hypothetical protein
MQYVCVERKWLGAASVEGTTGQFLAIILPHVVTLLPYEKVSF